MNEKELHKLIAKKQAEMEQAQLEYDQVHYSRQLRAFAVTFSESIEVLKLIQTEGLTADDCKLLARIMAKKIRPIYRNFAEIIGKNQEDRRRKNQARNERRHNASPAAPVHIAEEPVCGDTGPHRVILSTETRQQIQGNLEEGKGNAQSAGGRDAVPSPGIPKG